jgi:hypothetical protein
MSSIDNAIARLQDIALSSTDLTIRHAPDYPSVDATAFPMAIAHLSSGEGTAVAEWMELFSDISVDVYFPAVDLRKTYADIDAYAAEFMRRLSGDPALAANVDTIVFPVTFNVQAAEYNNVSTLMLTFNIRVKTMETQLTTAVST